MQTWGESAPKLWTPEPGSGAFIYKGPYSIRQINSYIDRMFAKEKYRNKMPNSTFGLLLNQIVYNVY